MSKFKKKKSGDLPAISTAALPDIVFMLLFFFMTATTMKDSDLKIENTQQTRHCWQAPNPIPTPASTQCQPQARKQKRLVYV